MSDIEQQTTTTLVVVLYDINGAYLFISMSVMQLYVSVAGWLLVCS